jgi:hypothetical protein
MGSGLSIDNRRFKRFMVNVKVYDLETDNCMGYTANMHTQGMMLKSFEKIELHKKFSIKLEYIRLDDEVVEIHLTARSLWCKPGTNPDFYNNGFRFTDLSAGTIVKIENLIRMLEVKS